MAVWSYIQKSQLGGALRLDAEYYQPKYLENNIIIENSIFPIKELGNLVYQVKNGFDFRNFSNKGYPYLRAGDVLFGHVNFRDAAKVELSYKDIKKEIKLKEGDIILTRKGTFGRSAVVQHFFLDSIISSEIIRIRIKSSEVNPYFLSTFLNSRFGYLQVEQRVHGVANYSISQEDLTNLKIPLLPNNLQLQIKSIIGDACYEAEKSYNLYDEAERTILEEIKFDKINFNVKKSFIVNLSATKVNKRIDGEHFHTRFKNLKEYLLKTRKAKSLKELRTFIKRGLQPEYVENGEIMVINSQHLGRTLLNIEDTERTDRKFFDQNKRSQLKNNDILFYSTGAYIGRTNIYIGDKETIASNHVAIIRTTKECNPIYLSVYLNSPFGLMQADQWASGSAQREIYPDDIDKFLVYLPSFQFQQKIADLVQKSHESRKKAKELLREAKRKVEETIQGELVS